MLLMAPSGTLITAYRRQDAPRHVDKKRKHRL